MFDSGQLQTLEILGRGGESEVYALDEQRVVRLYRPGVALSYVERRRDFYARLHAAHPAFETPLLLESGIIDGRVYTVEQRMRGRDFALVLPSLAGSAREQALASYLRTAARIGAIQFADAAYTELLRDDAASAGLTWPEYLLMRLEITLHASRPDLEQDVPYLDQALAALFDGIRELPAAPPRSLVHGDYFPGNVFIDRNLEICGVADFSYATVVGDARMDLAGALAFVELVDSYHVDDTHFLRRLLAEEYGETILPIVDLYRRYYAVYFSGCKADDPRTYWWCVRVLQEKGIR